MKCVVPFSPPLSFAAKENGVLINAILKSASEAGNPQVHNKFSDSGLGEVFMDGRCTANRRCGNTQIIFKR